MRTLLIIAGLGLSACYDPPLPPEPGPETPTPTVEQCTDPGFVPLRRLNRRAYGRALQQLLGLGPEIADTLPDDDVGYGFDTIGEVLSLSPLHLEQLEAIAETAVEATLATAPPRTRTAYEAVDLGSEVGRSSGEYWNLWSNGEILAEFNVPMAAEYELGATAWGRQAGPDPARMQLAVDGRDLGVFDVPEDAPPGGYDSVRVQLEAGTHFFSVAFVNDYYRPDDPDPSQRDRNLHVETLYVEGPFNLRLDNPHRDRLLTCAPETEACVRQLFSDFGRRAWRRPLEDEELQRLLSLARVAITEGESWEEGLKLGLRAILLSPHFIYLVEADRTTEAGPLSDHQVASRLALLLWGSIPDDELLDAADAGELSSDSGLSRQMERMLADPKASSLVEDFFAQWLELPLLEHSEPDYTLFPDFDEALRDAMSQEMRLVGQWLFGGNRALDDLLTDSPVFANPRLAEHQNHGLQGEPVPDYDGWIQLAQAPENRGGLLTRSSILTLTSYRRRTSPVKRGKWVMEHLLCDSPPAPPPGVEGLIEEQEGEELDLRARMERHRADPACAGCHVVMDQIGFGMEAFDAVGSYRPEMDSSGDLPGAGAFDGPVALQSIIAEDPRLARCFVEKVFIYGLGRGDRPLDQCYLNALEAQFRTGDLKVTDMLRQFALSPSFRESRMRREDEP